MTPAIRRMLIGIGAVVFATALVAVVWFSTVPGKRWYMEREFDGAQLVDTVRSPDGSRCAYVYEYEDMAGATGDAIVWVKIGDFGSRVQRPVYMGTTWTREVGWLDGRTVTVNGHDLNVDRDAHIYWGVFGGE